MMTLLWVVGALVVGLVLLCVLEWLLTAGEAKWRP